MVNRSALFRTAWQIARHFVARQGGSIRQASCAALKDAWASLRIRAHVAAALAAETATIATGLKAARAAGAKFGATRPWQFANCHPIGGM